MNQIVLSSIDQQEHSSQSFNIINEKSSSQISGGHKRSGNPFKNCYLVEIRWFYRYIQGLQATNQLQRNVQLISQRLMEHFPCAAEKILCEFFKLKMSHIPQSWRLFKNTLIDYLKMDIPEHRIRKIRPQDLLRFRQIFIKNIKYPHQWKQPRKGRSLSQLEYLESLFSDLTEEPEAEKEIKQEPIESQIKNEQIQKVQIQVVQPPTQSPYSNLLQLPPQESLMSLHNLISQLNEYQNSCFYFHQFQMITIENLRLQVMAATMAQ